MYVGPGDDAAVAPHAEGPRGRLHRPARRGPPLPPRVGAGTRHRPQGGRGQPLRHQRHGRHRALAHRRRSPRPPTCRCSWALDLADGITEEAGPGRRHASSAATSPRASRGGRRDHGARRLRGRARCCAAAPGPGDVRGAGRAPGLGGRRAGRARPAGSGRRGRWWRPTSAPSRRTPPGSAAAQAGATSMIDVSDGLLADIGHVAADSGVAIDVDPGRLRAGRADARGRLRARRRPDAVHPRRRRRPRDRGDLPGRTSTCRRASAGSASVSEPGEAGRSSRSAAAAYDGPSGWSHF